jgi:hypothetical protein
MTTYRGYNIAHNPKPIPVRQFDWDFWHDDYDGEGDNRCGSASSEDDAKLMIDDIEDESK